MPSYLDEMEKLLIRRKKREPSFTDAETVKFAGMVKSDSPTIAYSRRHRSQWFKPEYDFRTLQIAQHTESIFLRTIKKQKDRILLAGWEFVGPKEESVQYIKDRIAQMEYVSNKPFKILMGETAEDLARQNNSMWIKVRSSQSSSGKVRTDVNGKLLEPVAAYYIVQFEELEFKTKVSGELKKLRQVSADGDKREWAPQDVIHFFNDRKPGYIVGTPALLPALEDAALLRRIEENVEELIETNLFPAYHYKIGTDAMPERKSPEGLTESEIVKRKVEYMPAGSVVVSDHRHEITSIGAEGKALSIEYYLEYFKKRTIASAGATEVDLGIAGDSNRSTANTLSKSMIMDIKALQICLKIFIDFYVIRELLMEGEFDLTDPSNHVEIKFGEIDVEEQIAIQNQQLQLFHGNIRSLSEVRAVIGDKPVREDEEWLDDTFFKLFEEPLALAKSISPENPAGDTLAGLPSSNITQQAVNKGKAFAQKQMSAKTKATGGKTTKPGSSTRASAGKSRPSNQHGTRSSPKMNKDINLHIDNEVVTISVSAEISDEVIKDWERQISDRYILCNNPNLNIKVLAQNMINRLNRC